MDSFPLFPLRILFSTAFESPRPPKCHEDVAEEFGAASPALCSTSKEEGYLFPGLRDKRTSKMIELDLKAAGLPFKTDVGSGCFHALRNTYISQLFDAGLSVTQVQRFARHTDVRLTMKCAKPRADEVALVDDLNYPGLT